MSTGWPERPQRVVAGPRSPTGCVHPIPVACAASRDTGCDTYWRRAAASTVAQEVMGVAAVAGRAAGVRGSAVFHTGYANSIPVTRQGRPSAMAMAMAMAMPVADRESVVAATAAVQPPRRRSDPAHTLTGARGTGRCAVPASSTSPPRGNLGGGDVSIAELVLKPTAYRTPVDEPLVVSRRQPTAYPPVGPT